MGDRERTKVLWLAKGLGPGGMERLLVHHAAGGDHEKFDYRAGYLVDRPDSVAPELESLGVPVVNFGSGRTWPLALRSYVRDQKVDIVHSHSPMPAAIARPSLRQRSLRPKLVYTEHNTWDCYSAPTRALNLVTYALDDAQFAVSLGVAGSVPRPFRDRVEVLTHGIDLSYPQDARSRREGTRSTLGLNAEHFLVVNVAHLRAEKGIDVLLRSAKKVVERHPAVVFVNVGHGPAEPELRSLHSKLNLGDSFRFLGFRSDAIDLLGAADVFCLASRQEGLPLAFMEAVAVGLPIVVTAVGGLPGFIRDGENGRIVAPDDDVALSDALSDLVGSQERRDRFRRGACALAPGFDSRGAIRRQEEVYEGLMI